MSTPRYDIRREDTQYGFRYGSATVHRMHANEKDGSVVVSIDTPRAAIQVYVTRTGKVRVFNSARELR